MSIGTREWVHDRMSALPASDSWAADPSAAELVNWLNVVVRRRTRGLDVPAGDRADVAQDAMTRLAVTLADKRTQIHAAANPAALLERIAERAVRGARHRARMAGFGGVAANGQNWRAGFPRRIGGDAAERILDELPSPTHQSCIEVDRAADRVSGWAWGVLGIELTEDARHAVVYVLERLVAGVCRSSLLRGGHSALGSDPAMRHLGFTPASARTFAGWLLGRADATRTRSSVLDAALCGTPFFGDAADRWRTCALDAGFAIRVDRPRDAA